VDFLASDALMVGMVTQEAVRLPSEQVVVAAAEGVAVERKIMVQRAATAAMAGDALARVAAVLQGEAGEALPMSTAVGMPAMMERMAIMGRMAIMEPMAPLAHQVVSLVAGGFPVGRVLRVEMAREVAAAKGEAVAQVRGRRLGIVILMELERAAVAVGGAVAVEQAAQEAGAAALAMGSSWSAMVPAVTS